LYQAPLQFVLVHQERYTHLYSNQNHQTLLIFPPHYLSHSSQPFNIQYSNDKSNDKSNINEIVNTYNFGNHDFKKLMEINFARVVFIH